MIIRHLYKSYGSLRVLEDFSLTIGPGITCIMAPSGWGKTTLLRLILGLEKPDSGTISDVPGRFAAVFQENRLLEELDAEGNLRFVLGSSFDSERAKKLLGDLSLQDYEKRPVSQFSSGMKRRLALARALLASSDCLILDEPFTGLDEVSKGKAIKAIRAAKKQTILVTHDRTDAEALGAEIVAPK